MTGEQKERQERETMWKKRLGWLGVEVVIAGSHYKTKIKFRRNKTGDESQIFNLEERWVLKAQGGVQMGLVIQSHVGLQWGFSPRRGNWIIQNNALSLIDSLIDLQIKPLLKGICSLCRHFRRLIYILPSDFDVMCVWMICEVKGKFTEILSLSEPVHYTFGWQDSIL